MTNSNDNTKQSPVDIKAVAKELLNLQIAVADKNKRIDELKAIASQYCTDNGNKGYEEIVPHLGLVKVSAGAVGASKGLSYSLNQANFLAKSLVERTKLIKAHLVTEQEIFSKDSKPAVSIKPLVEALALARAA